MKVSKQVAGIKHWYGQDLLDLQGEPLYAIEYFLKRLGSCILQGCEVTGSTGNYNIAAGLVLLVDEAIGPKVCRFAGVSGVSREQPDS